MKTSSALLISLAMFVAVGNANAQRAVLFGAVLVDSAERPVAGGEITLPALGRSARSDVSGAFRLDTLPAGTYRIVVRLAGYVPLESTLIFGVSDTLERDFVLLRRIPPAVIAEQGRLSGGPVRVSRAPRNSGINAIRGDELRISSAANLYDALASLRPNMLRTRAVAELMNSPGTPLRKATDTLKAQPIAEGLGEPFVYVNDARAGRLDVLRSIALADVVEVRYLSPIDATTRFGTGHSSGAILVTLGAR